MAVAQRSAWNVSKMAGSGQSALEQGSAQSAYRLTARTTRADARQTCRSVEPCPASPLMNLYKPMSLRE